MSGQYEKLLLDRLLPSRRRQEAKEKVMKLSDKAQISQIKHYANGDKMFIVRPPRTHFNHSFAAPRGHDPSKYYEEWKIKNWEKGPELKYTFVDVDITRVFTVRKKESQRIPGDFFLEHVGSNHPFIIEDLARKKGLPKELQESMSLYQTRKTIKKRTLKRRTRSMGKCRKCRTSRLKKK